MRIAAILNREGGTLRTLDVAGLAEEAQRIFADAGHRLDPHIVIGEEVAAALEAAASDPDIEAILAGGGDGTISAAAAIAFKSGKPLAVLPAGTMNLFARALRLPLELDEALRAIAAGEVVRVDIATANGRPFVHQFGVGIHARLVRIRNGMNYSSRVGKMLASLRAIGAAAINPPRFEVELDRAGQRVVRTVSGIAVSNNPLDNAPIPVAERLDSGLLGIYLAASVSTRELLNLALDVFSGRWRDNPQVSELETRRICLRFPRRKRNAAAVIDGELIELDREVTLELHRQALPVLLPYRGDVKK
ncbi:MAG: diacylglycerol kinase family lipid kinase [Devosia sp.]|nr:diacylglycerol kinase family lipid kinase [Devosia sp.]